MRLKRCESASVPLSKTAAVTFARLLLVTAVLKNMIAKEAGVSLSCDESER